jgi:hypothetical protein
MIPTDGAYDELLALETGQDELRVRLTTSGPPRPLPNCIGGGLAALSEALADETSRDEAMELI